MCAPTTLPRPRTHSKSPTHMVTPTSTQQSTVTTTAGATTDMATATSPTGKGSHEYAYNTPAGSNAINKELWKPTPTTSTDTSMSTTQAFSDDLDTTTRSYEKQSPEQQQSVATITTHPTTTISTMKSMSGSIITGARTSGYNIPKNTTNTADNNIPPTHVTTTGSTHDSNNTTTNNNINDDCDNHIIEQLSQDSQNVNKKPKLLTFNDNTLTYEYPDNAPTTTAITKNSIYNTSMINNNNNNNMDTGPYAVRSISTLSYATSNSKISLSATTAATYMHDSMATEEV